VGVEEEPRALVVDHAGHRRGAGESAFQLTVFDQLQMVICFFVSTVIRRLTRKILSHQ
jgi:hypothetical protein